MTAELDARLRADLIRDEDRRLKPYRDSVGKLTIGVGRNLDDVGLSIAETDMLLGNDIARAVLDLDRFASWWRMLPDDAGRGLINMCFNLGWPRLSTFVLMLAALQAKDYERAATEALDSKWAGQVGDRADRIAALYRGCADEDENDQPTAED